MRQRGWLRTLEIAFAASVVGAVSALSAALVRWGFRGLQWCFTQSWHSLPLAAAALPPWRRVLTPVAGALAALAVRALCRLWVRRRGDPRDQTMDYVESARHNGLRIPFVASLWRTSSAAFSIATGAAVGREGSMIQFAAAAESLLDHATRKRWRAWRPLTPAVAVGCGVAGGVVAAYQAPVAAMFFAAEIVLCDLRPRRALFPLAFAATTGWLVSRRVLEHGPLYPLAPTPIPGLVSAIVMLVVAALLGMVGPVYQRSLRLFGRAQRLPLALVWGGLMVGLLALSQPAVWGNGDLALDLALGRASAPFLAPTVQALAVVLALRWFATAFDVCVGTVGGVFTPTLFAGAALGSLAASALGAPFGLAAQHTALALVGMSALLAAVTHAPLMSAAMAAELTGDWRLLPWLLAATFVASRVARRLSPHTLYGIATPQPVAEHEEPGI